MSEESSSTPAPTQRGYVVIDEADRVDVTSYDSFPASDPPSWVATGIGFRHEDTPLRQKSGAGLSHDT